MQRMFFHNQHDKESREILQYLKNDVKVYDVFGADRYSLPADIKLTILPYMVDKYISFTPSGPYFMDTPFVLTFSCMNHLDEIIPSEESVFRVLVNGGVYDIVPENGIIKISLTCPEEVIVRVEIDGPGYLPFKAEVSVVAEDSAT